ncbi:MULTISPECIES: hypothetical protein [Halorubrum]|uniref:hypothetical protein n=1 Tax=Halorubrum TaxID=56688 RepID=UPI0010F95EAE|nr:MULTISPECIES: hypothetical protein [Halorubrum]TKX64098.1 hypothetical protein EXE47_12775 [Halorubrum sp. GN12_10-3_MGM]
MTDEDSGLQQRASGEVHTVRTEPVTEGETSEEEDDRPQENTDSATELHVNGSSVQVESEQTAGELREMVGIDSGEVFTHRSGDGIQALSDGDVLTEHVEDGAELHTQPLADSLVFGTP